MRKKSSNRLFIVIGGIIVVIFVTVVIKMLVAKEPNLSPAEQKPDNPSPNPSDKLTEKELEKYLLEKRLELQKYIIFNLNELTKQWAVDPGKHEQWDGINSPYEPNRRVASDSLKQYLTTLNRLAGNSGKYPLYSQKTGEIVEWKDLIKGVVVITDKQDKIMFSFSGDELDKKITEGQIYIILKKNEIDWKYRYNGQETNEFFVKLDNSNIFLSKKEVREFLKKNDPTLQGKF